LTIQIAELVASRDAVGAEIISLDSAIERLDRISKSTCNAVAELAAEHDDHQSRVAAWSLEGGVGAMPVLNHQRVVQLEQKRDLHANDSASAAAGLKTLVEKRSHAKLEHKRLDRSVTVAALLVIVQEDLPRLADEAVRASQAAADRVQEFDGLRLSLQGQSAALAAPEVAEAIAALAILFTPPKPNGNLDAVNAKLAGMVKGTA
jgi:hypothetical protein